MKVLIIEDQEKLAQLIKKGLEQEGHVADYLTDGESGQKRIELHHVDYDVVVLDLMLPKRSGEELCKNIREEQISIPILVLTAKDGLRDKVDLLDIGADDYLIKPFEFDELVARLRAIIRRPETMLPSELKIGDLTLNPATKKVRRGEKEISLTLTEFRILEFLMRNPNRVIERENLVGNVWGFDFDSFSNIIDVYINRLRAKLNKRGKKEIIETIRGVGYKINIG